MAATKFWGAVKVRKIPLPSIGFPSISSEAMHRLMLPYSCSTPLGVPVDPEVYTAKAASWGSGSSQPSFGARSRICSQVS